MNQRDVSEDERELLFLMEETGYNDDFIDFLEEHGPTPGHKQATRIKKRVLKNISDKRGGRARMAVAAAVLLTVVSVFTLAAGTERVIAGLQSALHYIPGFGVKDTESDDILLCTPQAVVKSIDGGRLEAWAMVTEKNTLVRVRTDGNPGLVKSFNVLSENPPYLVNRNGQTFRQKSGNSGSGGDQSENWLAFPALPAGTKEITLVIPLYGNLQVGLPLAPPEKAGNTGAFSAMSNGVLITAFPDFRSDQSVIALHFNFNRPGAVIEEAGRYTSVSPLKATPVLTDATGKKYDLLTGLGSGKSPYELRFPPVNNTAGIRLGIPLLRIAEEGSARATITVPPDGEYQQLNTEVKLGRWQVKLTGVEKNINQVRVYVDTGPANESEYLEGFDVEPRHRDDGWSVMSKYDDTAMQMIYFQVDDPGKKIDLELKNPMVVIKGPWNIDMPGQ